MTARTRGFIAIVLGLGLMALVVAHTYAQAPVEQDSQVQSLQSALQQATTLLQQAQETGRAQAVQLVLYHQQVDQLQAGLAPACKATVEKANPDKLVDDKTWIVSTKPAKKER